VDRIKVLNLVHFQPRKTKLRTSTIQEDGCDGFPWHDCHARGTKVAGASDPRQNGGTLQLAPLVEPERDGDTPLTPHRLCIHLTIHELPACLDAWNKQCAAVHRPYCPIHAISSICTTDIWHLAGHACHV